MLERIRSVFPESIQTIELPGTSQTESSLKIGRTSDQDMLIGHHCLALTDKERDAIKNLTFKRYQASLEEEDLENVTTKVSEKIATYRFWGTAGGTVTGGTAGGLTAWYFYPLMPFITVASSLVGATAGGTTGYYGGTKVGYNQGVKDVMHSPGYIMWRNEQYEEIIFPALSRYMDTNEWDNIKLQCGIDQCLELDPVQDSHGHIFNRQSILDWFNRWDQIWPEAKLFALHSLNKLQESFQRLPEEQRQEILEGLQSIPQEEGQELIHALLTANPAQELHQAFMSRCPLNAGYIEESNLKELPDYYDKIFERLKYNYNIKILTQRSLVDRVKNFIGPLPEEVSKIVTFYSKTQEERDTIANQMQITALQSQKFRPAEVLESISFLNAAAQLPELV